MVGLGGGPLWICLAEDTKAFLLSEVCTKSLWVVEADAVTLMHGSNNGKPHTLPARPDPSGLQDTAKVYGV